MKNKLLFFLFVIIHTNSHSMLTKIRPHHIIRSSHISTRADSSIQEILDYTQNPKFSKKQKNTKITSHLAIPSLSKQDKNTLFILKDIIHDESNPEILHAIAQGYEDNQQLMKIAFSYGQHVYINQRDEYGNTPLYYAAINALTKIVTTLIQNNADVNSKNEFGKTPLIGITSYLHDPYFVDNSTHFMHIISYLINAGANPAITDNNNKTAQDYIDLELEMLALERHRTVRNEYTPLIDIYGKMRELLKE